MLKLRLKEEDCNVGAIFDNLKHEYWADEKFTIDLIAEAVEEQMLQLVLFTFKKESLESESRPLSPGTG